MLALLGNRSVVHHPRPNGCVALELRQSVVPGHGEDGVILPGCVRHEMVHALVGAAHMPRIDVRGHGLHALPLPPQQQPGQIRFEGPTAVGVADRLRQSLDVALEPGAVDGASAHASLISLQQTIVNSL